MSASDRFVHLQRGLIVPLPACELVLDLEQRGLKLWLEGGDVLVEGRDLTREDVANLKRWKPHVLLLLAYVACDAHLRDSNQSPPDCGPLVMRRQTP